MNIATFILDQPNDWLTEHFKAVIDKCISPCDPRDKILVNLKKIGAQEQDARDRHYPILAFLLHFLE